MPNYICELPGCDFETTDHGAYIAHKGGHLTGRIPAPDVDNFGELPQNKPGGKAITAEPIVEKPKSGQFNAPVSGGGAEKLVKSTEMAGKAPWQLEKLKKEGIKLAYQYVGYCPDCGNAVETLELEDVLEDKKKIVAVCWCPNCRKKQMQRTVAKL